MRIVRAIPLLLTMFVGAVSATSSTAPFAIKCPTGSLIDSDLAQGERLLPESDVVKVRIADQQGMFVRSHGRLSFPASKQDRKRYGLRPQTQRRWKIAITGGLVASDLRSAQAAFYENVPIHATYYPATRKLVVFTIVPHNPEARAFPFWVFVRAPKNTGSIAYDCSTFD